jgi:hypothetical protein
MVVVVDIRSGVSIIEGWLRCAKRRLKNVKLVGKAVSKAVSKKAPSSVATRILGSMGEGTKQQATCRIWRRSVEGGNL